MDAHPTPTPAAAAPLPDDPTLLRQMIRELLTALHDARRDNDHLRAPRPTPAPALWPARRALRPPSALVVSRTGRAASC